MDEHADHNAQVSRVVQEASTADAIAAAATTRSRRSPRPGSPIRRCAVCRRRAAAAPDGGRNDQQDGDDDRHRTSLARRRRAEQYAARSSPRRSDNRSAPCRRFRFRSFDISWAVSGWRVACRLDCQSNGPRPASHEYSDTLHDRVCRFRMPCRAAGLQSRLSRCWQSTPSVFAAQLAAPGQRRTRRGCLRSSIRVRRTSPSTRCFSGCSATTSRRASAARGSRASTVAAAIVGLVVDARFASSGGPGITAGATCAITGVLGAYFVLLPKSRVLMLVPAPPVLTEIPAVVFLALWWLLHLASFAFTARRCRQAFRACRSSGASSHRSWSGAPIAGVARRPMRLVATTLRVCHDRPASPAEKTSP